MASLVVLAVGGAQLSTSPLAFAFGRTSTDFELFSTGSADGQDGWTVGHGSCAYDVAVVPNTYGYPAFGTKSLRISNAVTCPSFNDQLLSTSLADEAGETSASTSSYSGGTRQPYFQAQWTFASTVPGSEQPGLSVVASPSRGDTMRMSWLQMTDTPSGLQLNFEEYRHSISNFVLTPIATGLDRTVPHTVKITMLFVDGPENDVVKVYLDGALIETGTSWEDYYRDFAGGIPHAVDSIMFRVAGTAAPATAGSGFLIDNFSSYSGTVPTTDLTGLSLSSGTLSPAFDPSVTSYSASVPNSTTSEVVTANTSPGASVVVSGGSNLVVGANTITITVTAADGLSTRTSTLTVTRAAASPTQPSLGPPRSLVGSVQATGVLALYWEPPAGDPAVAHYTVWKDGRTIGVTGGSTYQLLVPGAVVGDTSIFEVSADDGDGNVSLRSPKVTGVPDLTGLTVDEAHTLLIARGFTPVDSPSGVVNAGTAAVIGQDPSPLPAYRPIGSAITVVSAPRSTAGAPLVARVSSSRRTPLATRHSLTPRILTSLAATATISLTGYKRTGTSYAKWTRVLTAGANYLTLKIPAQLKIALPGVYRLTVKVQAQEQSRLYSVPYWLYSRPPTVALPKREADVLLVKGLSLPDVLVQQLAARYVVKTADMEKVYTATQAPNERVGAVVLDANEVAPGAIRHLHRVFPDLRIVAVVSSAAASTVAKSAGASITVVDPNSTQQLAAELIQALRTTLGK